MSNSFLRGELSKLFNIKAETLRYYSNIGILTPDVNPQNGYSIYKMEHMLQLSFILKARYLNISINDIKNLQNKWDIDSYEEFIDNELNEIRDRKKYLNEIEKIMKKNKELLKEILGFKNNYNFQNLDILDKNDIFYKFKLKDFITIVIKEKGFLTILEKKNIFLKLEKIDGKIEYNNEMIFIEKNNVNKKLLKMLFKENFNYEEIKINNRCLKEKILGTKKEIEDYIMKLDETYTTQIKCMFLTQLTYVPFEEIYFVETLVILKE